MSKAALQIALAAYGAEMDRAAGWRERNIMSRATCARLDTYDGAPLITIYTAPDETGRRDSAQYSAARHTWTN